MPLMCKATSTALLQGGERQELQEFTSLEYEIKTCEESSLEREAQQAKQDSQQAAAELADIRSRLVDAESSLQQRRAEVGTPWISWHCGRGMPQPCI